MRHRPSALRASAILILGIALASVVIACGAPVGPASPPAETPPAGTPADQPPGTFQTDWGAAWEALPPGFPLPPGAVPADPGDPADEPASGAFVVDRPVDLVVEQVQAGLRNAGYRPEAAGGPAEDGSLFIEAAGQDPDCRVRAVVRPFGQLTLISYLFAAACPWR
jgi:hypothetical protein